MSVRQPPLGQIIRDAIADRRVTWDEWTAQLKPIADAQPLVATPETRQLVELWADGWLELDPGARHQLREALVKRGYPIPTERPSGVPTGQLVDQLVAQNVGEIDEAFEALVERTGRTSGSTTVAVLDTGFDLWHRELGRKGWVNPGEIASNGIDEDGNGKVDDSHGWDFIDWNNDVGHPQGDWHGTHVAGVATQGTDRIDVIPLRLLQHPYEIEKFVEAVEYAIAHGARAINMSFGMENAEQVRVMKELFARHPDVLFVLASGNDNRPLESYSPDEWMAANPYANVAVVAAADANGNRWERSNYGATLATHAAQGADVHSTIPGSGYAALSGTSFAAPQVVNAAAKCLVLDPELAPEAVKFLLAETSDRSDAWRGQVASGGPINPERASQLAAMTGLMRRDGISAEEAADRVGIVGQERDRLLTLAERLAR